MKNNLARRTKLLFVLILTAVLIAGGVLGYLFKTGKLGIGADTDPNIKTYTISGRSFDPLAQAPMEGQTINVTSDTGQTAQVTTDVNGNYSVSIKASIDGFINVSQGDGGIEGSTRTFVTSSNDQAFTSDFNIGNPPFDEGEITSDFQKITESESDYKISSLALEPNLNAINPVIIDGVNYLPFVVPKDPNYNPFDPSNPDHIDPLSLKDQVDKNYKWFKTLKSATGVTKDIPIILVSKLDWDLGYDGTPNNNGYYNHGKFIVWNIELLDNIDNFSHEYGHHVDWVRGHEAGVLGYSSQGTYFTKAFQVALKSKAVTGYATNNPMEMFAVFFDAMFTPLDHNPNILDPLAQYGYTRDIGIYLRHEKGIIDSELPGSTNLVSIEGSQSTRIQVHNVLMYIYKHVAKMSQQNEYFPGEVLVNMDVFPFINPSYIPGGFYMKNSGVVTITIIDHNGKPIEFGVVEIENIKSKIEPADPDYHILSGNGRPLMPVETGNNLLSFSDYPIDYPIPFLGQTLDIKPGSNYFEISYRKSSTQYKLYSEFYPTDRASEYGNPPVFAAELTHKTGLKIKGLKQGDIPRYPTEGTYFGYGQYDKQLTDMARANGEKNTYYYKVDYVIGGDDENLFPLQAKFTGPMGAMPPQMLATYPIPTATTQEIKKVSDIVTGILTKKCDYIKYPNVAFPNMCF